MSLDVGLETTACFSRGDEHVRLAVGHFDRQRITSHFGAVFARDVNIVSRDEFFEFAVVGLLVRCKLARGGLFISQPDLHDVSAKIAVIVDGVDLAGSVDGFRQDICHRRLDRQ